MARPVTPGGNVRDISTATSLFRRSKSFRCAGDAFREVEAAEMVQEIVDEAGTMVNEATEWPREAVQLDKKPGRPRHSAENDEKNDGNVRTDGFSRFPVPAKVPVVSETKK